MASSRVVPLRALTTLTMFLKMLPLMMGNIQELWKTKMSRNLPFMFVRFKRKDPRSCKPAKNCEKIEKSCENTQNLDDGVGNFPTQLVTKRHLENQGSFHENKNIFL